MWTDEYEKYLINLLDNVEGGKKRNRQEYHIRSKYTISELAGVTKVSIKSDDNILYTATKENALAIIKKIHTSIGHKGEKNTYKKIKEKYANILRTIISELISQCERCTEKLKKREIRPGLVIKPITVKDFNERVQVDLVNFQSFPERDL